MKTATARLVLETRVSLKDRPGSHPVVLQFYFERKRASLSTGIAATEEEFQKIMRPSPRDPIHRAHKYKLDETLLQAEHVIRKLGGNFKLDKAKRMMESSMDTKKKGTDLVSVFKIYIANLEQHQQVRTADSYRNAMNSLSSYHTGLDFDRLTTENLQEYEDWMVNVKGKSITTVGIYLRSLKAVYNFAVKEEIIDGKNYPFGKGKFVIPTGRNVKKALSIDQIRLIRDYKTIPGTPIDRAKDFFLFSYLVNGINFRDILELKNNNLTGQQIQFVRTKTERTKRDYTTIKALIRPEAMSILEKWRNTDRHAEAFLFPILTKEMSPKQVARKVQDYIKDTNIGLKQIEKDLELPLQLTTYVARHTFATIALNHAKVSLATISAALGHSSLETTKSYLDSLDDKNQKNISDSLF